MRIRYRQNSYGFLTTECPYRSLTKVGGLSCNNCQYCKSRDIQEEFVICGYEESNKNDTIRSMNTFKKVRTIKDIPELLKNGELYYFFKENRTTVKSGYNNNEEVINIIEDIIESFYKGCLRKRNSRLKWIGSRSRFIELIGTGRIYHIVADKYIKKSEIYKTFTLMKINKLYSQRAYFEKIEV